MNHNSIDQSRSIERHQKGTASLLHYLAVFTVAFGIFVRIVQYLGNRSLWRDEASLALNIVHRSYLELLQPLDHNQAAPPGFLWIEKLSVQLFGHSEYSLRLFPFLAGIISLVAFYKIGKWAVSPIALPIAITLFACLKFPLYYAIETKQYSSDVMIALLSCCLLIPLRDSVLKPVHVLLMGLLGAVAIWVSYPAIFVLAGLEAVSFLLTPTQKKIAYVINRLPAYVMWIISFLSLYLLSTAKAMKNQSLQTSWGPEYPNSIVDLPWFLESFRQFFDNPLGFHGISEETAVVAFMIGFIAFLKKDRVKLLILLSPILATLAATYLHKYPFRTRLILFLTPFFILIIAQGAAFLLAAWKRKYIAAIGVIMTGIFLLPPAVEAVGLVFHPSTRQEIRPVIEYIKAHQQPGDGIYLDARVSPDQLQYYLEKNGYSPSDYVFGYDDLLNPEQFSEQGWQDFQRQSSYLKNKRRVWFVFSGIGPSRSALALVHLERIGQQLDHCKQVDAFTYLYQLK